MGYVTNLLYFVYVCQKVVDSCHSSLFLVRSETNMVTAEWNPKWRSILTKLETNSCKSGSNLIGSGRHVLCVISMCFLTSWCHSICTSFCGLVLTPAVFRPITATLRLFWLGGENSFEKNGRFQDKLLVPKLRIWGNKWFYFMF